MRQAWFCESMSAGTLHTRPVYGLGAFIPMGSVSADLLKWVSGGWKDYALVLSGKGGFGKTEFACALAHLVAPAKTFHFVNRIDRVRDLVFAPGEALVVDEACLATRDIDDAKALVNVKKTCDVMCRNRDGVIPAGTPRIFSTNWKWDRFWPREASDEQHAVAIRRRVLWVPVKGDLRRRPYDVAQPTLPEIEPLSAPGSVDDDPMGFGFDMD